MKYFLNIAAFLFILVIALPQNATASCCTTVDTCDEDGQKKHHDNPCENSSCHCTCCGNISIILLQNHILETEKQADIHFVAFSYEFLQGANFHSTIWQPPRLGYVSSI